MAKGQGKEPDKKTGGRPPYEPTPQDRAKVETMAGLGFKQDEIALVMAIDESTLKRHFQLELRIGAVKADVNVMQGLYKDATTPGYHYTAARIYWAKVRRRWHEVQRVIHGYDPEIVSSFVRQVVSILRRKLPDCCPHCKTPLEMPRAVGTELIEMSRKLAEALPPSEIVAKPFEEMPGDTDTGPRPPLAH